MDKAAAWQLVHRERAALGRMLANLTPAQWERPSLCEGWSVRDVAAHVISWPDTTLRQTVVATWRARGDYNRMLHDEAQRRSARPTAQLVADFGRLATARPGPGGSGSRSTPGGSWPGTDWWQPTSTGRSVTARPSEAPSGSVCCSSPDAPWHSAG